jgi:hypothetical protein
MFTIPQDLSVFSVAGLEDMLRVATDELRSLRASVTDPSQVDDDTMTRMRDLHAFGTAAQEELDSRAARAAEFATLELIERQAAPAAVETPAEPAPAATPATTFQAAFEAAGGQPTEAALEGEVVPATRPSFAQVAQSSPAPVMTPERPAGFLGDYHSLVAANELENVHGGSEMTSWRQFADAFVGRTRTYPGSPKGTRHPVATIQRNFDPSFILTEEMSDEAVRQALQHAADETRLEGGSLVAANGWCSPSETLYSTCLQISTDGLLSLPEVVARRGGIRHNQGIEFDSIFGTGTGFNILTEAQVIADTPKTCVEIPCPPFVDDRLDVSVLCLTGSILQNRAYPEFVETFVRGALATFAHFVNRSIIAQIVAGSTAVTPSTVSPWSSDLSLISNLLGVVEMAIEDIRYRLRLPLNSTVEIVLPHWILPMMRQDFSRRTGFDGVGLTDQAISAWFTMRGARVQYVYDWQDAFSGVATGPGADTPITTLPALVTPKSVQFLAYPAGTWVLARLDVIRLESIYDSVNLPQNLVTQLFMEDGFKPMRMCPLSRVYTVEICPSGATTALQSVVCTDITP